MDTSSRLAWPCGVFALWLGFIALTKQWAKADEEQLQTVVNVRMKHPPHGKLFNAMNRLGYCLFKQGNVKPGKELERAEDLLNRGYLELEHYIPQMPEHLRLEIVGTALQRLIEFYDGLGRAARADIFRNKLTELELKEGRPLSRRTTSSPSNKPDGRFSHIRLPFKGIHAFAHKLVPPPKAPLSPSPKRAALFTRRPRYRLATHTLLDGAYPEVYFIS